MMGEATMMFDGSLIKPDTDRVTEGFHEMPIGDDEYAAYACKDGCTEP